MFIILVASCLMWEVSSHMDLKPGDECRGLKGVKGFCKPLSHCQYIEGFKKKHPPICSFQKKEPVICCPERPPRLGKVGDKTERYCEKINSFSSCKKTKRSKRNSVVGGVESLPRTRSYMALVGYGNQSDIRWNCGGTLISDSYVLSAAHCAETYSLGPAMWIRVGDLDISTSQDDSKPIDVRIAERIVHPSYQQSINYYDIALFRMERKVTFSNWVMPACLHTAGPIDDLKATVTGWGRTDFVQATSDRLLEAELVVYNDTECERLMFNDTQARSPQGYLSDLMFCSGVPDGSKDACLGDSGGPLVISETDSCVRRQIGITSYGNQCGLPNSPGVYTRVSTFIPWIEENVDF